MLSLVGPEYAMGKAFLALQGAKNFTLQVHVAEQPRFLFNTPLQSVVRLDRDDLNRWLMDQTGSVSYVPVHRRHPADALRLGHPDEVRSGRDRLRAGRHARRRQRGSRSTSRWRNTRRKSSTSRRSIAPSLISGWDIPGSLARVEAINTAAASRRRSRPRRCRRRSSPDQPEHTHDAGEVGEDDDKFGGTNFVVDSTTEVLLERMQNIARLIGVVSLLVALPLLWMAWVLAANLAGLLMLNERRTLGLMRLRGISGRLMGRALLISVDVRRVRRRPARPRRRIGRPAADLRARPSAGRRAARRPAARNLRARSSDLGRARTGGQPPAGEVRDDDLAAGSVGARVRV